MSCSASLKDLVEPFINSAILNETVSDGIAIVFSTAPEHRLSDENVGHTGCNHITLRMKCKTIYGCRAFVKKIEERYDVHMM